MIQLGDSDWIINPHPACAEASAGRPLGIDSRLRSMTMELQKMLVLIQERTFYLAASHRQIKKSLLCACAPERFGAQVRPRRLCGENSILDKNGMTSSFLHRHGGG
jgi:hypothetical protein